MKNMKSISYRSKHHFHCQPAQPHSPHTRILLGGHRRTVAQQAKNQERLGSVLSVSKFAGVMVRREREREREIQTLTFRKERGVAESMLP